jgi:hypothetical protein
VFALVRLHALLQTLKMYLVLSAVETAVLASVRLHVLLQTLKMYLVLSAFETAVTSEREPPAVAVFLRLHALLQTLKRYLVLYAVETAVLASVRLHVLLEISHVNLALDSVETVGMFERVVMIAVAAGLRAVSIQSWIAGVASGRQAVSIQPWIAAVAFGRQAVSTQSSDLVAEMGVLGLVAGIEKPETAAGVEPPGLVGVEMPAVAEELLERVADLGRLGPVRTAMPAVGVHLHERVRTATLAVALEQLELADIGKLVVGVVPPGLVGIGKLVVGGEPAWTVFAVEEPAVAEALAVAELDAVVLEH